METPFKTQLRDKLKNKELTNSSINLYLRSLEKLNNDEPLKNLNFLKDPENILKKLENYKENTKRSYLIAITSILSTDKNTKTKEKLYNAYLDMVKNKNKELKKIESNNELSETQAKNWINWQDALKKVNKLKEENNFNKKVLNEKEYNKLLQYVIGSLYTLMKPRRNMDYQKCYIVKIKPNDNENNYLVLDDKQFIFNVYKTMKKGQKIKDIPDNMMEIINLYMKHHPGLKSIRKNKNLKINFLVYYDGKPLDKINSITRILNSLFGANVGSSMLRHSFITFKWGDIAKEQKEDAEDMGHSVSMQRDYIKNID